MPARPSRTGSQLAWVGALLITVGVLAINIVGPRLLLRGRKMTVSTSHERSAAGPATRAAASAACRRASDAALNEPRIAIRNLDFFYGDNRALKGISLDLPDRQVTGMIGPSGCGKSTLLRVLNRMYDLYPGQRATGEVMMDGENIIDAGCRPRTRCARGSAWCSRSRRRSR